MGANDAKHRILKLRAKQQIEEVVGHHLPAGAQAAQREVERLADPALP